MIALQQLDGGDRSRAGQPIFLQPFCSAREPRIQHTLHLQDVLPCIDAAGAD
jgi:hypothetical protein